MSPVVVVIADVFRQQAFQMAFAKRNHVIQHISPATSPPTLRASILPGAAEARSDCFQPYGFYSIAKRVAELGVGGKDQILVSVVIRKGFAQLLGDPQTGWMPSDIAVQNPSSVMCNDEEAVQDIEGQCWNREEIHRRDGFTMVVQEGLPTLC